MYKNRFFKVKIYGLGSDPGPCVDRFPGQLPELSATGEVEEKAKGAGDFSLLRVIQVFFSPFCFVFFNVFVCVKFQVILKCSISGGF